MSLRKIGHGIGVATVVALVGVLAAPAGAQTTYTWQLQIIPEANWNDPGAWSPSGPPQSVGDIAYFPYWTSTDPNRMNLSLAGMKITLGEINFTGYLAGYTILPGGDGNITMNSGTLLPFNDPNGFAWIRQNWPGGKSTLAVPITMASSLNIHAFDTLTFTQGFTAPDPNACLAITGGGLVFLQGNSNHAGGTTIEPGNTVIISAAGALGTGPVAMPYDQYRPHFYSLASTNADADHSSNTLVLSKDATGSNFTGIGMGQAWSDAYGTSQDDSNLIVLHKFGGLTYTADNQWVRIGPAWPYSTNDQIEFTGPVTLAGHSLLSTYNVDFSYTTHAGLITMSGGIQGDGNLYADLGAREGVLVVKGNSSFTGSIHMQYGTLVVAEANAAGGSNPIYLDSSRGSAYSDQPRVVSMGDTNAAATHANDLVLVQTSAAFADNYDIAGLHSDWTDTSGSAVTHTFGGLTVGRDGNNMAINVGYWYYFPGSTFSRDSIRFTGPVVLHSDLTTLNTYQSVLFDGAISGAGKTLVKDQAGTLTLNAPNNVISNLTVSAGTLVVNAEMGFAPGSVINQNGGSTVLAANAALGGAAINVYSGNLYLNESNCLDFGTLNLAGAGSHLWVNKRGALGSGSFTFNGGTVEANVDNALVGPALLQFNPGSALNLRNNSVQTGASVTLNGVTLTLSNTVNLDLGMNVNIIGPSTIDTTIPAAAGKYTSINNLTISNSALTIVIPHPVSDPTIFRVNGVTSVDGNAYITISGAWGQSMSMGGTITGSGKLYLTNCGGGEFHLKGDNNHTGGTVLAGGYYFYAETLTALGTGPVTLNGATLLSVAGGDAQANRGNDVVLAVSSAIVGGQGYGGGGFTPSYDSNIVTHTFGGLTFATPNQTLTTGTWPEATDIIAFTGTINLGQDGNSTLSAYQQINLTGVVTGSARLLVAFNNAGNPVVLSDPGNNYTGGTRIVSPVIVTGNVLGSGPVEMAGGTLYCFASDNAQADHSRNNVVLTGATASTARIVFGQGGPLSGYIYDDPNVVAHKFGGLIFTVEGQSFNAGDWYTYPVNGTTLCGNDYIEFTGTSVLEGNSLVTPYRSSVVFSGPITGNGALVVHYAGSNSGTVTLANTSSSYTGGTVIERTGLALDVTGSNAMGTGPITIMDGSALNLKGASAANSTGSDVTVDGLLRVWTGGSGVVGAVAPGAVTYPDANFNYIRAVQLDAGSSLSVAKVRDLTVTVGDGAALTLRGGTSQVPSLTLAGATDAWTGLVDIRTSYVILPSATEAEVLNQVKQGANWSGTHWAGTGGITTSAGGGNDLYSVGVADNAIAKKSEFGDANGLPNSGVLVRYTYVGDTNLDGITDLDKDYYNWSFGYLNAGNNTWYYGDFNYDGQVDLDKDYYIWSYGYLNQGSPLVGGAESAVDTSPSSAPVPEPATVGLLGLGLLGLLRRRSRKA